MFYPSAGVKLQNVEMVLSMSHIEIVCKFHKDRTMHFKKYANILSFWIPRGQLLQGHNCEIMKL